MDRLKCALSAGWVSAVPFVMLHAAGRWQGLAALMGAIIGIVMYQPATPPKA